MRREFVKKMFLWAVLLSGVYLITYSIYLYSRPLSHSHGLHDGTYGHGKIRATIRANITTTTTTTTAASGGKTAEDTQAVTVPICPDVSPHLLGPFRVDVHQALDLDSVREQLSPSLQPGGRFTPKDCAARQKVALIVPFRHRHHHLKYLLHYLHPFLQRQQARYGVYVVNQAGDDGTFNKCRLMNAGFLEALKEDGGYDCFIFHDVDMIPMDDRNAYRCADQPRHLAVAVDKFGFRLTLLNFVGGVVALSKEQFMKINGFSNRYWGWGTEDDDIYMRLHYKGMAVSRPSEQVARYTMIKHARDAHNEVNKANWKVLEDCNKTMATDGINSVQYTVVQKETHPLYTFITVDVGQPEAVAPAPV